MASSEGKQFDPAVLNELRSGNIFAKVLRVARETLVNNSPPTVYPEFVPQHGESCGRYFLRDADFWTCGFFPGILYILGEMARDREGTFFQDLNDGSNSTADTVSGILKELTSLCDAWTGPIRAMATRTDTHDLGFILLSIRRDWEITGREESLQTVLTGAQSLASRYVPSVGAIRSWDVLRQEDVDISSLEDDCLVIVDSMMNLDLLYFATAQTGDPSLAEIATTHARTVIKSLLRPEPPLAEGITAGYQIYSSYHVVNLDPHSGNIKQHRTAQGYSVNSSWARGQAWAIYGFTQTYLSTKEKEFLDVAIGLAEYFAQRLEIAPVSVEMILPDGKMAGRYVPLWDFDAPIEDERSPLRDSSAGVIAANGTLLLSQALNTAGSAKLAQRYHEKALLIVSDTIAYSLATEKAQFVFENGDVRIEDVLPGQRFDAILKNATANHNSKDHDRYSDHGLVYADYYLLEFGLRLGRMGLL